MRVGGEIRIGEANRWAGAASARLTGDRRLRGVIGVGLFLAALLIAMSAAAFVGEALQEPWVYPATFFATLGILAALLTQWLRQRSVSRVRRHLMARGVSDPLPWTVSVEAEGLKTVLGEVVTLAPWSAVSEIFPVGPYWILLVQGSTTFVPTRDFTNHTQERAFVAAVLERLTPEAKGRSGEAAKFASA